MYSTLKKYFVVIAILMKFVFVCETSILLKILMKKRIVFTTQLLILSLLSAMTFLFFKKKKLKLRNSCCIVDRHINEIPLCSICMIECFKKFNCLHKFV